MKGVTRVGASQLRWTCGSFCLARHAIRCVWFVTGVPHCDALVSCVWFVTGVSRTVMRACRTCLHC